MQESFLSHFTSAQPVLQRFVAAHIPDLHEVEDVMQEIAICLWKNFDDYDLGSSFRRWAIRVAQYKVLHARRSHARRRVVLTPGLADRAAELYSNLDFETVEARRRALDHCLERLPPAQRELVVERYRSGKTCARIARQRGSKESLVRTRLCRIRSALRKCVNTFLGPSSGKAKEVPA